MARAKKPAQDLEDDLPTNEEITYAEFLEDLGDSGVTVQIHRYPKVGKDLEWCEDAPIDVAKLDVLRERWGPGKYRLLFRGAGSRILGQRTVSIAPVYGGPAPAVGTNGDAKQSEFMQQILMALIAAPKPAVDIGAILQGMAQIQAANKPVVAADPSTMLAAVVTAFATLKGAAGADDAFSRIKEAVSLVKDLKDDKAGGEDNVYTVVRELGEKVVDTVGEVFGGGKRPATVVTASIPRPALPPGARPMPAAGEAVKPEAEGRTQEQILQDWLRVQLKFFKDKALAGKAPDFWIDYLFENQEEPGCAAVLQAIERGAKYEHLLQFDPEIAQNPALSQWFKTFYDGIRAELNTTVDTGRPAGDTTNPGNDAAASDRGQPAGGSGVPGA